MARSVVVGVVFAAVIGSACSSDPTGEPDRSISSSTTTWPAVTTSSAAPADSVQVPPQLEDFGVGTVRLDGTEMLVAIADDATLRPRGLMNVTDLGDLQGMVFVWENDTDSTFWMRDTLIPLDIAWFAADGSFVSQLTMPPCDLGDACPNYAAEATFRFALEMPAGTMPALADGSILDLIEGF